MNTQAFLDQTLSAIKKYKMLEGGDAVVVAVSGGPDSTALLLSLFMLRKELGLDLHVWHLNHLIRPEAAREADHVGRLASKLGLPATMAERDVKAEARAERLSVQEAGRKIRYNLLEEVGATLGGAKIAVGHNAEDSVETFFINLLRGSGLAGLRGIPPVSGRIVRPLIECERSDILAFLSATKTEYIVDPSNIDTRYLRNHIRAELLPLLRALRADPIRKITETVSLVRDEEAWLAALSRHEFDKIARMAQGEIKLDAVALSRFPAALKRRVIRLAAGFLMESGSNLDFATMQSIMDRIDAGSGDTNLPGGAKATLSREELVLSLARRSFESEFIPESGGEVKIDHSLVSVTIASPPDIAVPPAGGLLVVDAAKIDWPLEVRARRDGDWFFPLGMAGKKKLHDFFIDEKIPRRYRDSIPIFADRHKVVAVGNMRIDDRVKLSPGTKTVAALRAPNIIS